MKTRSMRRLLKTVRLLRSPIFRKGLRLGVGAAIEHHDAMRALSPATVVDVGANIGQFSLLIRHLHPGARIHAFEPLPDMASKFEHLFANDPLTTLYRAAAGAVYGSATIHRSARPDSSSLLSISDAQNRIFPGTAEVSTEEIDVVRIDDVLGTEGLTEPLLVKLDVQGFELAALKGMPRLLERAHWIYVEISFIELYNGQPLAGEIIGWLAERNFVLTGAENISRAADGTAVQVDALFSRSPAIR